MAIWESLSRSLVKKLIEITIKIFALRAIFRKPSNLFRAVTHPRNRSLTTRNASQAGTTVGHNGTMMKLDCTSQLYAWGKTGTNSSVARFKKSSSGGDFDIDESEPYAELWMGTHPSGPSRIAASQEFLKDWLIAHPNVVGRVPNGYIPTDLPFLFKVLSIKTALSIQAHPDRELAIQLHSRFPENYKDANHKPEMSIALTPFEALCGFQSFEEIQGNLKAYPEFYNVIDPAVADAFLLLKSDGTVASIDIIKSSLRELFTSFMSQSDSSVNFQIAQFIERLSHQQHQPTAIEEVILRLHSDYPNDRGIFCPLLLNYISLRPGDSFFMGPNEPHAYLSGDCIECMALSDNVVRAGLTPKFKDVDTLCSMLHYRSGAPALIQPIRKDPHTLLYRPPSDLCAEFEVEKIDLTSADGTQPFCALPCASIIIVTEASNASLEFSWKDNMDADSSRRLTAGYGDVIFLAAGDEVTVTVASLTDDPQLVTSTLYRAHVNLGDGH